MMKGEAVAGRTRAQTARLGLLRALGTVGAPIVPRRALPIAPRRILVIRPDHLGDALFTTPALRALRDLYPLAQIDLLAGPWSAGIYGRLPSVDCVLPLPFPGFAPHPKTNLFAPYALLWQWAGRLRSEGYDLAVNMRFDFWWGALLAYSARIPARLGYAVAECKPFLNHALALVPEHAVAQNLRLVAALAEPTAAERQRWLAGRLAEARLVFPQTEGERAVAASLDAKVAGTGPLVVIHPGTRGLAKMWVPEAWAEVGDALVGRLGARLVLTGSAAETDLCRAVAQRMTRPATVMAGNTSLGELVALFARCALVLGVDSGPLHMAVAVDTPTVHLYGPSDQIAFGPFGDRARHAAVSAGCDCSPCHKFDWPVDTLAAHPCMREIRPVAVLAAANAVLAASAGSWIPGGTDNADPWPA
ncbi:MAG: lipopolysaccharide heptosyltransferase II [Chloroflexota bacterium]